MSLANVPAGAKLPDEFNVVIEIPMNADPVKYEVDKESLGDAVEYLEDGMECEIVFYEERAISVELPTTVVREISYTEPAVRGDAISEKRVLRGRPGAVDQLVRHHDVTRREFLAQATHRGD